MLDFCIHDNRKFVKCTFYRFKVDVGGTAGSRLYSPNEMLITYMLLGMIKIGQGDILQSSIRYLLPVLLCKALTPEGEFK
jgi:hypothetical protein